MVINKYIASLVLGIFSLSINVAFSAPTKSMLREFNREFSKLDRKNRKCKLPLWTRSERKRRKEDFLSQGLHHSLPVLRFMNRSNKLVKKLFSGPLTCEKVTRGLCAWELEFDLEKSFISHENSIKMPSQVCSTLHQWSRRGGQAKEACSGLILSAERHGKELQGFKSEPPRSWYREKCGLSTAQMVLVLEAVVRASQGGR